MPRRSWLGFILVIAVGCRPPAESAAPTHTTGAESPDGLDGSGDPVALSDALEGLIEEGRDSEEDRVGALERVRAIADDGSAGYAFARAALAGRVAELRGIKAGKLVAEAETYARLSIERDPQFRDRAASRLLGSLWVQAPPRLLDHGDSEEGLSLLESLVEQQPDHALNHLRLAEAYVFLGDPDPAISHLCIASSQRDTLRRDDAQLLDRLQQEALADEPNACEAMGEAE